MDSFKVDDAIEKMTKQTRCKQDDSTDCLPSNKDRNRKDRISSKDPLELNQAAWIIPFRLTLKFQK